MDETKISVEEIATALRAVVHAVDGDGSFVGAMRLARRLIAHLDEENRPPPREVSPEIRKAQQEAQAAYREHRQKVFESRSAASKAVHARKKAAEKAALEANGVIQ